MTGESNSISPSPLDHERAGLDACVHCGFCLQACPTYLALDDENDSPRGRIVLMHGLLDGTLSPDDPDLDTHIRRCLGCRACETACPSGVPYGHLLEATRATLRERRQVPFVARVMLRMFAHPWLTRIAMGIGRFLAATPIPSLASRLPSRYGFAMAMLTASETPLERGSYDPAGDESQGDVALLTGCVMEGIFTETNRATERVLTYNDYRMVDAPGQRCCGALHAHAGDLETACTLARRNIAAFERSGAQYVATNSAGCGAMLKDYGHLLANDLAWHERATTFSAKVRDVSELLVNVGPKRGGSLPFHVTYDAPCHLQHGQRIVTPPLAVLAAIPDLQLTPLSNSDQCCGSAGIYNLIEPDTSNIVLDAKLANIAATRASLVVTGNPGCLMQIGAGLIRAGMHARVVHPIDLLDASYAGED